MEFLLRFFKNKDFVKRKKNLICLYLEHRDKICWIQIYKKNTNLNIISI